MRVLIITGGTHGDVNPFLAVGCELKSRGHDVICLVHPYFRESVEEAGLTLRELGPEIDMAALIKNPDVFHPRRGPKLVFKVTLDTMPITIAAVREAIRELKPDVVLTHFVMLGVRSVCEQAGVPCGVGVLAPIAWFSRHDPVPSMQQRPGDFHAWWAGVKMRGLRKTFLWVFDRKLNPIRAGLGLPREKHLFLKDFHGGGVNLALWSRHFRGPMPDDPERGAICGFPWFDGVGRTRHIPAPLRAFLDAGEEPLLFTLGSGAYHAAPHFYEHAMAASAALGKRCVLLVGDLRYAPAGLVRTSSASDRLAMPKHVMHAEPAALDAAAGGDPACARVIAVPFAPFSLVMPRSCINVHHGGIGSTAQGLRSGKPSLVTPLAHDQFNNGVRVQRLGVGRVRPLRQLSARVLTRELGEMLRLPEVFAAAARVGPMIAAEDGAAKAAELLECLTRDGRHGAAVNAGRVSAVGVR
jgi:rhamnosyltransferase subunit B